MYALHILCKWCFTKQITYFIKYFICDYFYSNHLQCVCVVIVLGCVNRICNACFYFLHILVFPYCEPKHVSYEKYVITLIEHVPFIVVEICVMDLNVTGMLFYTNSLSIYKKLLGCHIDSV